MKKSIKNLESKKINNANVIKGGGNGCGTRKGLNNTQNQQLELL